MGVSDRGNIVLCNNSSHGFQNVREYGAKHPAAQIIIDHLNLHSHINSKIANVCVNHNTF